MPRVLRLFSLTSLLAFAVFAVLTYAFYASAFAPFEDFLPRLAQDVLGTTGFALAFAAGVLAVGAALQQRQRGWAGALLTLVILTAYGYYLAIPLLLTSRSWPVSATPFLYTAQDLSITQYIPAVVLAGLVLVYSFLRPRAAAMSTTLGADPA